MQDFGLFVAHRIGLKRYRRLHRRQAEQLHHVVGDHVAQGSGIVEVSAAAFHAYGLGVRDLHVIDVAAVPDGLEDGVVEAEDHDVLHGLFAQVVIDAENLVLRQHALDVAVQGLGRIQIVAERLLDDHAPPVSGVLLRQSGLSQLLHDRGEELGRGRQIEEIVALRVALGVDGGEALAESGKGSRDRQSRRARRRGVPAASSSDAVASGPVGRNSLTCARNASTLRSSTETPITAKLSGSNLACTRLKREGSSLRLVRSPAAPKSTKTHGPATLPANSVGVSGLAVVVAAMR